LNLLIQDRSKYKSIYISHWPEILKLSGKTQQPILIGNYIKFNLTLLDSIQIFNLNILYHLFVEYTWKQPEHIRIDSIITEISNHPTTENPLKQVVYVPLRELVRHFDGYDHVNMDNTHYRPLELPSNTFNYSKDTLKAKMTPYHISAWTDNNYFMIPQEWININASLYKPDIPEYTLTYDEKIQIENFKNINQNYVSFEMIFFSFCLFILFYVILIRTKKKLEYFYYILILLLLLLYSLKIN